ncbi:transcriptional regulator [Achromobacter sp. Root83]|uniref:TetR/AcrR family transcriptional regulator n=1 Tax=Achromobacter sp. Root83 TaxID=1736602 RepID=UPI000708FE81|nr:TetR/AcrR family transcriptional regulator [Achromobacter sp. Root83]KRC86120.1 transcriptional regulator [Achromobacter sp. Root83]
MTDDAGHERLLVALALAMVDQPRATLQELAKAVGVSKATLYRFCKTRDQLVLRLMTHCAQVMKQTLADSHLDCAAPPEALRRLIEQHLAHKELTVFLIYNWKPDTELDAAIMSSWSGFQETLDAFFLRGQREGAFRVDIPAAGLSELFLAVITSMVDAERRGRVARLGIAQMAEQMMLHGIAAEPARAPG